MTSGIEAYPAGKRNGYTLVELVVAAVCLGVAISGVMTMIAAGRRLETDQSLRRQACMYLQSALERDEYHYNNFDAAASPDPAVIGIVLNAGTANPVAATLSGIVYDDSYSLRDPLVGPDLPIPFKHVTFVVQWPSGAPTNSITATRRITKIR
jgi:hypothetical protein